MAPGGLVYANPKSHKEDSNPMIMKILIATFVGTVALSSIGTVFAQGNSEPGIDRYENSPGRQQAIEVGAQCDTGAGSGAFGYFGRDLSLAGGADGTQTGLNNSAVCGNRP
jgi:hypothetical protein